MGTNVTDVAEADREKIWSDWLDGDSVARIAEWGPVRSRAAVKAVLAEDPPPSVAADPRHVHGGRFFWIASAGAYPFVVALQPRRVTGENFKKALRAIRRMAREDGCEVDPYVIEGVEGADGNAMLLRRVAEKGYPGFRFDGDGNVSRIDPASLLCDEPVEAPKP